MKKETLKSELIEYWQTDFQTKLNIADGFISELAVKFCEQKMKQNKPLEAVEFSKRVYRTQEVFNAFRTILNRAEIDNNKLLNDNKAMFKEIQGFKIDNKGINSVILQDVKEDFKAEIENKMKLEMDEFKDKYQKQIQELEIENDQLLKQLIKKNNLN